MESGMLRVKVVPRSGDAGSALDLTKPTISQEVSACELCRFAAFAGRCDGERDVEGKGRAPLRRRRIGVGSHQTNYKSGSERLRAVPVCGLRRPVRWRAGC